MTIWILSRIYSIFPQALGSEQDARPTFARVSLEGVVRSEDDSLEVYWKNLENILLESIDDPTIVPQEVLPKEWDFFAVAPSRHH
jgi:hypothetical protein